MKIKYNYIFFPILIIMVVAFWWVTRNDENVERSKLLSDRSLINFETMDVIEVETPDSTIRLEKVGGSGESGVGTADDWRMVSPYETGCNPESLAALIETLKTVESERDIEDITPEQVAEYGLESPGLRVKVASSGSGDVMMDLLIGEKSTSGTSRYAMFENTTAAFLVPIYNVEGFQIDLDTIRDQRVMRFDRNALASVQLSSAQDEITIENIDDSWMVTSPRTFVASPARMDVLFHDLEELRTVEFLPDMTDEHFNTRNVDVTLIAMNGDTHDFHIFGEDYSRGLFATSSWQPSPFILEAYILSRLAVPQDVFVYNVLIDLPRESVTRILLRQPGDENIEIVTSEDFDSGWDLIKPEYADRPTEAAYNAFIDAIYNLEPASAAPDAYDAEYMGLSPSFYIKVEVESETNGEQSVKIGFTDDNGDYFATMDDMSFVVIERDQVESLIGTADYIRFPG